MKWERTANSWFASGSLSLLGHFYWDSFPGTNLLYFTMSNTHWVIVLKRNPQRTEHGEGEVPRDTLAVLQASWALMSHFNRMRLYQLPSRFSSLAIINWWPGNDSDVSVIPSVSPPYPIINLLLFAVSTGFPWSLKKKSTLMSAYSGPSKVHLSAIYRYYNPYINFTDEKIEDQCLLRFPNQQEAELWLEPRSIWSQSPRMCLYLTLH